MVVLYKKAAGAFLFIAMLSANRITAQQKNIFSLSDFIDSAQHHLPVLMQKMAVVNAAKAGVTDARHAYLPTALLADEVNAGTDNSLPGSYFSYGVIPSTSNGIRSENNYQAASGNIAILQSNFELMNFGLKKARIRSAESYVNLSQADLDREVYLVKWEVGKLYFEILKNQLQLAIDQQNVDRYQTIYTIIHAITSSGIKPGADSSLAIAELSKSRINFNQTEGQIRQLQQQLAYLTGIPVASIYVDTTQTKNYLSTLNILFRGTSLDTLNNPLTDYYVKQKNLQQQAEDVVKKSYLPRVLLTGAGWARGSSIDYTGEYKAFQEGLGYQRFNYMVGVSLVYDLVNPIHRKDKLAISHYNTVASDYDLQQQILLVKNITNQADEAIRTSVKNLQEIPIQIQASRDTYDQKTAQYKAGIINLIDLTNASFVLYRSQSDYVQTISDWLLANLNKAAATGDIELFIQSIKK